MSPFAVDRVTVAVSVAAIGAGALVGQPEALVAALAATPVLGLADAAGAADAAAGDADVAG
jgi:hypothetical protein